jgi:NAD(P)H-dependent flavin oxidoreductase YrpB (nitropropane dioxygenase family)
MKHLPLLAVAFLAIAMASCTGNGTTSASKASNDSVSDTTLTTDSTTAPSREVVDELSKAVAEEHADPDAKYSYDAATNTVKIVKQVEVPSDQAEEDFAEAIVEHQVPEFISQFKKSTKPSDATIKSKGATITVSYVNKATGEEITQFDITPEDLK